MRNVFATRLRRIIDTVLDWFFPRKCLQCESFGSYFCEECFAGIKLLERQSCPNCRKQNIDGCFCDDKCGSGFYFDQLLTCLKYERGGVIGKLVKQLKYRFSEELVGVLGRILKFKLAEFSHNLRLIGNVLIVPVPLSRERLNYRGFNQALLLAKYLAKKISGMQVYDCLLRKSGNLQQAKSDKNERLANLQNTIFCKMESEGNRLPPDAVLKNKIVILVDDVATTGATLNECARALKLAGVKYVCGLVLARGNLKWQT